MWLCRQCHVAKRTIKSSFKEALYTANDATSAQWKHLKTEHKLDKDGNEIIRPFKRLRTLDNWTGAGNSEAKAIANSTAAAFNQHHFKALLYDWIIHDNISFNQLESKRLHRLFVYLQPRCEQVISSKPTISRTVATLYDKCLGAVTETLKDALTKISLSFDLWTSNNKLAVLGLCAHFINIDGQLVTSLLALPRQKGRHTGLAIADSVSAIISEYDLTDKIGWFTTDNASANQRCMNALASEYRFDCKERWIRCAGHIFNLVGQAALLGLDDEAFAKEVTSTNCKELELL